MAKLFLPRTSIRWETGEGGGTTPGMSEEERQGHIDAAREKLSRTAGGSTKVLFANDGVHSNVLTQNPEFREEIKRRRLKSKSRGRKNTRNKCTVEELNNLLPRGKNSLDPGKLKRTV